MVKSPNVLDYEGITERINYGVAKFRYVTTFKDTNPSITLKVAKTIKELIRRDIVLWGETSQIESLHLLEPSTYMLEDDFRMTVILKSMEE